MTKATFVMGAVRAGKTHFIENSYFGDNVERLDVLDYQKQARAEAGFGEHVKSIPMTIEFRCLLRANERLLDDIVKLLRQGKDVVVEQTFYMAKRRIAYFDEIRKIPDVKIEVYVINPSDAFWRSNLERNGKVESFGACKREAELVEFPNPAEGIDVVYEVVDGDVHMRMEPPTPEILEPARKELAEEAERIHREDEANKKEKELLESMEERKFWHYCEVCGKKAFITADEAYDAGWDYPPKLGRFGWLSPRKCGKCGIKDTLFWKINGSDGLPIVLEEKLSPEELVTWRRIKGEPESLLEEEV